MTVTIRERIVLDGARAWKNQGLRELDFVNKVCFTEETERAIQRLMDSGQWPWLVDEEDPFDGIA